METLEHGTWPLLIALVANLPKSNITWHSHEFLRNVLFEQSPGKWLHKLLQAVCWSLATNRSTFLHYWCRFVCWVPHYCTIQSFESHTHIMRSHMCSHGNTAECDANKLASAHMSFIDSFPAMTFFLCWTTTSLLIWLYICWAKCVHVSNSNWCITDEWACTAEYELRPAICASQYVRQLFVVACLSFDVSRGGWVKAQVEAWYPHVFNTWSNCIATYTPFLPAIACNTICAPLSSSSPLLFPAMRLRMAYISALHYLFLFHCKLSSSPLSPPPALTNYLL